MILKGGIRMMKRKYCPKSEGHGVDTCDDCCYLGDDCDGEEEE